LVSGPLPVTQHLEENVTWLPGCQITLQGVTFLIKEVTKNGVLLLIVGVKAIHALYHKVFGCSWLAFCSSSLASAAWTRKLSLFSKSYPLKVSCYKKDRSEEKQTLKSDWLLQKLA